MHERVKRVGAFLRLLKRIVPPAALMIPLVSPLAAAASSSCNLGANGNIKHVIYVQFDNTHLLRDNAGVPSDLEQMPHLLNFIKGNGTLLANDHTVLISHTAGGILSSLTGLYPDGHGQTVSNSYVRTSSTGPIFCPASPEAIPASRVCSARKKSILS